MSEVLGMKEAERFILADPDIDPNHGSLYRVRMKCTNCLRWFPVAFAVGRLVHGDLMCPICGCQTVSEREQ